MHVSVWVPQFFENCFQNLDKNKKDTAENGPLRLLRWRPAAQASRAAAPAALAAAAPGGPAREPASLARLVVAAGRERPIAPYAWA